MTFSITRFAIRSALVSMILAPCSLLAASSYPTADAAAAALVQAVEAKDHAGMDKVLGAGWRDYIPTGDIDRVDVDAFINQYNDSHRIVTEGGKTHLAVGPTGWTLPIPLVKQAAGWSFDLKAGHDEVVARIIGKNELDAVQSILAYCDAQLDYAKKDRNGDGVHEYAQKLLSTEGKHDGLYWASKEGEPDSPLGPAFANTPVNSEGYHGYHYRILKSQGPSAPGGAYDYMVGGRMRSGFAIVAWPVKYGATGVMSFITSHDGEVVQKDLGKDTAKVVESIKKFDPDSSWSEVKTDD
jgi:Protein of unknown function (DUF2950)